MLRIASCPAFCTVLQQPCIRASSSRSAILLLLYVSAFNSSTFLLFTAFCLLWPEEFDDDELWNDEYLRP